MSQISKCPTLRVVLGYWEALGEVSEMRYNNLLYSSSKRSYCSCSCFSCCRWSCWSWRSSCHRYANWSPRSNASGSDDGAAWSTSTIAFVSIRRFHSTWAMTTTKVAHIIGTAGFRSIKISRQSFRFVKGPRSRTCRHPLWWVELSPSKVKVGHGGGVRRLCRLKLDDWKL